MRSNEDIRLSTADRHAAYNIGRVLADRCQQSGISYCIAGAVKEEVERSQRVRAAELRSVLTLLRV